MASIIYVDALNGSDSNSGGTAATAVKSLAAAASLIQDGSQIFLRGGQTWNEQLTINSSNVTVSSFGDGGNAIIDGGGLRHGVLIQAANATINNVDAQNCHNGIYAAGDTASVSVNGGTYTGNGTGIVAGFGAVLTKVDGSHCLNSTLALGAGDGIQVCEDAGLGPHTFTNIYCSGNAKQGLNFKIGAAYVSNSTFEGNGETGVLGQVNASLMVLDHNIIRENNTVNNGTFNLGLENNVEIRSSYNVFANPTQGSLISNNVNMSGASKFYSSHDQFIENANMTNIGSTIRTNTVTNAATVSVSDAVFDIRHANGYLVDTWGASNLSLSVTNSMFNTGTLPLYRTETGSLPSVPTSWFSTSPQISISEISRQGAEDTGTISFEVTRLGSTTGVSSVSYSVVGIGSSAADASDFVNGVLPAGTLTFNVGETSKIVTIAVNPDLLKEGNETFQISLGNVSGATLWNTSSVGTILNDDTGSLIVTVPSSSLFTLPDSQTATTSLTASAGKTLYGTSGADLLTDSGSRVKGDRMVGGAGDDTYVVRNARDVIVEQVNGGIDTVQSYASNFSLAANVENLVLRGTGTQTGVGNAENNRLVANNSGSSLRGEGGNDILVSGKGGDTLTGGSGSDIFQIDSIPTVAARITDFTIGVDILDLRNVVKATGYTGSDAFGDGIVKLQSNGVGGTNVLVDANGIASGGETLVAKLDNVLPASLVPNKDILS